MVETKFRQKVRGEGGKVPNANPLYYLNAIFVNLSIVSRDKIEV